MSLALNPLMVAGLLALTLAALTAMALVPLTIRVARATRTVDYPTRRRLGEQPTPRIGGIAIGAGIAAGAGLPALGLWLWSGGVTSVTPYEMLALSVGTLVIFLLGLTDDVIGLTPLHRLMVQTLAALGVVAAGWSFDSLYLPGFGNLELGFWGPVITLVWIVGVTNAINLLDGLDGLAGGVTAIIATSLLVFSWIAGNALTVVLMAGIVGASLGFLRHNWTPARIYMGDSGSLTLGFLLAVMSVHGSIKNVAAVAILVPILALGLPVIDTLLVMTVRIARQGQGATVRNLARILNADRNHLHHLMLRMGKERKRIVLSVYALAGAFCAMALVVALSRSGPLGIALVSVEIIVVLLIRGTGIQADVRAMSLTKREQVRDILARLAAGALESIEGAEAREAAAEQHAAEAPELITMPAPPSRPANVEPVPVPDSLRAPVQEPLPEPVSQPMKAYAAKR